MRRTVLGNDPDLTARFTVRLQTDPSAARLAAGWASQHSGTAALSVHRTARQRVGDFGAGSWLYVSRVWLDSPERWRHELSEDNRTSVVVVDVPRWWCLLPDSRAFSNEADPTVEPARSGFPYEGLFRPDDLTDGLDVHEDRRGEWQGHQVVMLSATPREEVHADLPRGADRYDLVLDVEQHVVRRVVASAKGEQFATIEIADLAFDVALPANVFVLHPPPGVTFVSPTAPRRHSPPVPPSLSARPPYPR